MEIVGGNDGVDSPTIQREREGERERERVDRKRGGEGDLVTYSAKFLAFRKSSSLSFIFSKHFLSSERKTIVAAALRCERYHSATYEERKQMSSQRKTITSDDSQDGEEARKRKPSEQTNLTNASIVEVVGAFPLKTHKKTKRKEKINII